MLARCRIVNPPVAGQLVGLLPVLASALSVALSGKASISAVGLAYQPQRQGDVYEGQHVVHALRLLFGAPSGQNHCGAGRAEHVSGPHQLTLRDAGDALHTLRPVGGNQSAHLVESLGVAGNVIQVKQALADDYMQQSVGQRGIGTGNEPQMQVGFLGGGSKAGVGDDKLSAVDFLRLEILHDGRHRLR